MSAGYCWRRCCRSWSLSNVESSAKSLANQHGFDLTHVSEGVTNIVDSVMSIITKVFSWYRRGWINILNDSSFLCSVWKPAIGQDLLLSVASDCNRQPIDITILSRVRGDAGQGGLSGSICRDFAGIATHPDLVVCCIGAEPYPSDVDGSSTSTTSWRSSHTRGPLWDWEQL